VKKSLFSLVITIIWVAALLVGCAQPPAPTQAPQEPAAPAATEAPAAAAKVLKVGVLAPFTGPSGRVGEEFKNSVTMAFDKINWTVGDTKK